MITIKGFTNEQISYMNQSDYSKISPFLWNKKGIDRNNATEALFKFKKCLDNFNLKFWLVYGTALGLYRDGDFIPWDDDVDTHVLSSEFVPIFYELRNFLIQNDFVVRAVHRGKGSKMSLFFKGIKLQIQGIYDFEKDPTMVQTMLFQYPKKFYENYETVNYKGEEFRLPGPKDEYLTFCYDDSWSTPQDIPDWKDYMNPEQLKDASWLSAHKAHNRNNDKWKK
tara:strand:- start:385 stop:1056 length:672 start_codon:yes stop_codon:yes gene_type:complete